MTDFGECQFDAFRRNVPETQVTKWLFMLVNVVCVTLAYCILGFAVVDIRILDHYGEEQMSGTITGDVIIICGSLLLIAIAIVGVVGALKRNLTIIYTYIGLLTILISIQMMIFIFVALERHGLQLRVTEWLRADFFRNVTEENRSSHTLMWDKLQMKFKCCGLNGPEDYPAIQQPLSVSCCWRAFRARTTFAQQQLYKSCIESASYFSHGCEDKIVYLLRSEVEWFLGAAIFCFLAEGAGMVLARGIASNIKNILHINVPPIKLKCTPVDSCKIMTSDS